jgi:hypothetical protein
MADDAETLTRAVSSSHRRAISVRLRLLEEAASQLLDLFGDSDGILRSRRGLPEARKAEITVQVNRLRSIIAQAKVDLDLETSRRDAAREADATIAAMVVNIEETLPRYLKGYGAVPTPLAQYLERLVAGLLEVMRETRQILEGSQAEAGEP